MDPQKFIESIIEQAEDASTYISAGNWEEASSLLEYVRDDAKRLQQWVESHL